MSDFNGLHEDMYRFFWELAFHNHHEFMDANRDRYKREVQKPLLQLIAELLPTALSIDPQINPKPGAALSRINRDTRYTKDKSPYRDNAWIGFRHAGTYISESFVLYAEFQRESYGYGMGMWCGNPAMMNQIRTNMLSSQEQFLELVGRREFASRFQLQGESYKRTRYASEDKRLEPYLNMKSISYCYSSPRLDNTFRPELADEIKEAFILLKPVYRLLMGLD